MFGRWLRTPDLTFTVYWQLVEAPAERSKSRWLRTLDVNLLDKDRPEHTHRARDRTRVCTQLGDSQRAAFVIQALR
jgi:hypothetical protein